MMQWHDAAPVDEVRRLLPLRRIVILTACSVGALNSGIIALWITHAIFLHPFIPFLFEVKFNGALAFTAGAIGLLAAQSGLRRLGQASGVFLCLISALTMMEYLTGRSLGIDQLLITDFYATPQPFPGRIFRNSCLGFLCVGVSLLLAGRSNLPRAVKPAMLDLLGFVTFAIGAQGMLGHLQPGAAIYDWAKYVQEPWMASAGFMTLSIGLMTLAGQRPGARVTLWLPGMVCLLVLVLDIGTPRALVAGIAYIPLIYCSEWFERVNTAFYFAAIGSLLTTLVFFMDGAGTQAFGVSMGNRALTIIILWITAALVYRRRISESAVRQNALEEAAIGRSQMVVEFKMDGTIIRANENFMHTFGYSMADVVGKDEGLLFTEDDRTSREYVEFWAQLRKGVFQSGVFKRIDKQGNDLWIQASYNPVPGLDGRPFKVVKLGLDVTDRVKVQGRLQEAETRLKAILDSVADGIITIDAMGSIVSFNSAATKIFGYEESEAVGKNIKLLMPEPDRGAHDGYLAHHQPTGKSTVIGLGRELMGLGRTGRTFPMELTVTETSLQGRKFFVGLVRDISEKRRQEEALRKSEDYLDRSCRLASVGGWELDLLTREVNWSKETRRLHGFETDYVPTLEEGINFYAPEARPVIAAAINGAMTEGKDWEVVVPVIRVDGSRIWARVTATVQFDNGKPVRLVGAFQDVTVRVAEQEALTEANERAALAAESCGIGIWEVDLRSSSVKYDSFMYRLYGLEPDCDMKADVDFWMSHVHSDDRPAVEQAFREGIAGTKPFDTDFRVVWDDGSIHHIRATGKVTHDRDGNAVKMVGTNMEITAAKLAEEALRRSVEYEQLFISGVKDYAILMLSPQGFVSTWNEGTEKIKGYSAEEIVGYHFSKFYTPEDIAQGVPARELQIATDTGRFEDEGWRMRKDGSRFWANVVLTALFDAKGQLRGFAKVTRDITERKRAEEALRNQANLLDLSHDGIMVRELDGTIRFWNYGAEEMYGFSKHQAEGRVSHEILRTVFPKPLAEIEADLSRNGRWEGELEHTTQDGTHIVVDSRWVLQKVNNGAANRVLEVNNDITERKRVEGESQQKTQALMRSNQELDAFAYAASHDLKAPLRVIHNASKWIEEDLAGHLTAEAQENMDLLRSRVRRMDRLLDDLLEYSRIGRVTEDRDAELVSGTDLMENILGLLAPPEEFVVDTSSTLVGIEVARMPVQQILINLISNAIKHHDKKAGRIGISVEDLGEMLLFSVKDDGPGIPAQYHEKIFKMFQTLKPRDQVEGSGMGLAMVRKHVEVAGGEIKLESAVGQGSTFSFTWPKDRGSTNQTEYKVARIGETS